MNDRLINLILGKEAEVYSRLKAIIFYVATAILSIELSVYLVKAKGYAIDTTLTFDLQSFIKIFSQYYIFGFLVLVGGIMFLSAAVVRLTQIFSILFWWLRYCKGRRARKALITSGNFWFSRASKDKWEVLLSSKEQDSRWQLEYSKVSLLSLISYQTIVKNNFPPFYFDAGYALFMGFTVPTIVDLGKDYFVREYMRKKVRRLKRISERNNIHTTT